MEKNEITIDDLFNTSIKNKDFSDFKINNENEEYKIIHKGLDKNIILTKQRYVRLNIYLKPQKIIWSPENIYSNSEIEEGSINYIMRPKIKKLSIGYDFLRDEVEINKIIQIDNQKLYSSEGFDVEILSEDGLYRFCDEFGKEFNLNKITPKFNLPNYGRILLKPFLGSGQEHMLSIIIGLKVSFFERIIKNKINGKLSDIKLVGRTMGWSTTPEWELSEDLLIDKKSSLVFVINEFVLFYEI